MSDHDEKSSPREPAKNNSAPSGTNEKFDKRADALRRNLRRRKEEAKRQKKDS